MNAGHDFTFREAMQLSLLVANVLFLFINAMAWIERDDSSNAFGTGVGVVLIVWIIMRLREEAKARKEGR